MTPILLIACTPVENKVKAPPTTNLPTKEEIKLNPRSRSAKLRIAEKL